MNDMTEQADLTDAQYWEEVFTEATERHAESYRYAEQQADWDAEFYAMYPTVTPLNDDFTTT